MSIGNHFKEDKILAEVVEEPIIEKKEPRKRKQKTPESETSTEEKKETTTEAQPKQRRILGLTFMLLSVVFFLSILSYAISFTHDFDKVAGLGWWQVFSDPNLILDNWMGKLGAIIGHVFVFKGFGICSLAFCVVMFFAGFGFLFNQRIFSWSKIIGYTLFTTVIGSVTFGFLLQNKSDLLFIAGQYGYEVSKWLQSSLGLAGEALLLLFAFAGLTIHVFDIKFAYNKTPLKDEDTKITAPIIADAPPLKQEQIIEHKVSSPVEFNVKKVEPKPTANNILKVPELEIVDEIKPELELEMNVDEIELDENEIENDVIVAESDANDDEVPMTIEQTNDDNELTEINESNILEKLGAYDPTLDLSTYKFPELDLLEGYLNQKNKLTPEELKAELETNKNKIVETLGHYNIGIEKIKATVGPTVTLFEIVPQAGVRISKIKNLEDDIALSLSALGIRIIAPIPGKGTIGIEVPNQTPEIVSMRSVIASEKFQNSDYDLPIVLGKTISNEVYVCDLAKMPHLLMAGATGQGKSVGLNAVLVSLLYKKHPSQVKFILVDPKKVELTLFKKIERHFLAKLPGEDESIITDTKKVVNTLNSLCIEMDNRYELLKEAQVRNLKEYNQKFTQRRLNPNNGHRFLPYIVLVVDEFADLIMTAGREVETPIARLAQLARAIGIHLIIATQRPSVNIITGTIKANFPARIAFRVTSKIDSRTILDAGGADQLIGRGDMLLSTGADLIRIQCAFVDTPEVEKITEYIGSQRGYSSAFLLPEYVGPEGAEGGSPSDFTAADRDPLFEEAAKIIVQFQQGSASLLQRRLKLGYNRAGRLVDQLEAAGIIGPFEGSKAREVRVKTEAELHELLLNQ